MRGHTYTEETSGITVGSNDTVGDKFLHLFEQICREDNEKKSQWLGCLHRFGIKAAHPDDGWVNREKNYVDLTYPYFDLGAEVGDEIVLGSHEKWRIGVVTKVEHLNGIYKTTRYWFVDPRSEQ